MKILQNLLDVWEPLADVFFHGFKESAEETLRKLDLQGMLLGGLPYIFTPIRLKPLQVEFESFEPCNVSICFIENQDRILPSVETPPLAKFLEEKGEMWASDCFTVTQSKRYATTFGLSLAGYLHVLRLEKPQITEEAAQFCINRFFGDTFGQRIQAHVESEPFGSAHIPIPDQKAFMVTFTVAQLGNMQLYLAIDAEKYGRKDATASVTKTKKKDSTSSCVIT